MTRIVWVSIDPYTGDIIPYPKNISQSLEEVFEDNNYSMKRVFAEVASYCMGE